MDEPPEDHNAESEQQMIQAPLVRKRKLVQAFNATKDKNTIQIIKENATTSPLFKLPPEIREMIWNYLLGRKMVHISYEFSGSPITYSTTHRLCVACISEKDAAKKYKGGFRVTRKVLRHPKLIERSYAHRHHDCSTPHNQNDFRHFMFIEFLRTCRQAYIEANPVLWSKNIWSFEFQHQMALFLENRAAAQRRFLRHLHVNDDFAPSLQRSVMAKLPKLATIHVSLKSLTAFMGLRHDLPFFLADKVIVTYESSPGQLYTTLELRGMAMNAHRILGLRQQSWKEELDHKKVRQVKKRADKKAEKKAKAAEQKAQSDVALHADTGILATTLEQLCTQFPLPAIPDSN